MHKIIERFIKGKISKDKCEDRLVITDDFIAVIDGVSSKSSYLDEGKTTGYIAADLVKEVIENLSVDSGFQDFIYSVNNSFYEYYEKSKFDLDVNRYGLQAVSVVYSRYYNQIWLVGDCVAVVNGTEYVNPKPSDTILEQVRSLKAHIDINRDCLIEKDYFDQNEASRKFIEPLIVDANIFANDTSSKWGYSVLNGSDVPVELCKIIDVSENDVVVLASDGYPKVFSSLEDTENHLADVINNDPYLYKDFVSTKGIKPGQESFDDRTYIKFEV